MELFGVAFPQIFEVPDIFVEFDVQSWSDYFELYYVGDGTWASDTFDAGPCAVTTEEYYSSSQIGRISATLVISGLDAGDVSLTVTIETYTDEDDDGEPDDGLAFYSWTFTNHQAIINGLCSIQVEKTGFTDDVDFPIDENLTCTEDKNCMCVIPVRENEVVCGRQFGEGCIKDENIEFYVTVLGISWSRFYVVRQPIATATGNATVVRYAGGSGTTWDDTLLSGTTTLVVAGTGPQEVTITYGGQTYTNTTDIDPLCPFNGRSDDGELICIIPVTIGVPVNNTCCDRLSRPGLAVVDLTEFETTTGFGNQVIGAFEILHVPLDRGILPGPGCGYVNEDTNRPLNTWYYRAGNYFVDIAFDYTCGPGDFGEGDIYMKALASVYDSSGRGTGAWCEAHFTDVEVDGQSTFVLPFAFPTAIGGVFNPTIGLATNAEVVVQFSEPFTLE